MRFLYPTLAAVLSSIVAAQNSTQLVSQLPTCAYSCLVVAGQSVGCLDTKDFSCYCGENRDAIIKLGVPCIAKGCSTVDSLTTQKIASQICKAEAPVISSIVAAAFTSKIGTNSSVSVASTAFPASTNFTTSTASTSSTSSLSSATTSTISTSTMLVSSATSSGTSTSGSSPAQTSKSIGSRLEAGGVIAGAALLVAFAL